MKFIKSLMVVAFALPLTIIAQEDSASASDVEEVVVVGSQIKGANSGSSSCNCNFSRRYRSIRGRLW